MKRILSGIHRRKDGSNILRMATEEMIGRPRFELLNR